MENNIKKENKHFITLNINKKTLLLLFSIIYLFCILFIKFYKIHSGFKMQFNIIPFQGIDGVSDPLCRLYFLNLGLFIPMGILIMSIHIKRYLGIILPLLFIIIIEVLQAFFGMGVFDTTTCIFNALGVLIGTLLYQLITHISFKLRPKY